MGGSPKSVPISNGVFKTKRFSGLVEN